MTKQRSFAPESLIRYALQSAALCALVTSGVFLWSANAKTWEQLSSFPLYFVPILLALICCSWICTTTRFWLLFKSLDAVVSYRQVLLLTFSTEFGIAASPGGVGGTAIFLTILHRSGVPSTTATSVLAADLAVGALFFLVLIPSAMVSVLDDPSWWGLLEVMPDWRLIVGMTLFTICLMLVLLTAKGHGWLQKTEKLAGSMALTRQWRVPARLRLVRWRSSRWLAKVWLTCAFLIRRRRKVLLANLVLAAIQWTARYGILPCILLAFSIQIDPWALIAIQGLLMTSSMLVVLPGGGGGVEVAMSFMLKHFAPHSLVGVIVLLWRLFTYYINLAVGGIVLSRFCHNLFNRETDTTSSSAFCPHPDAPRECQVAIE